jgi:hypothetical protein
VKGDRWESRRLQQAEGAGARVLEGEHAAWRALGLVSKVFMPPHPSVLSLHIDLRILGSTVLPGLRGSEGCTALPFLCDARLLALSWHPASSWVWRREV